MSITQTYTVIGMTCDHCVRSVTEEVSAVEGVTATHVELASGLLTLTTAQPITLEQVRDAVEEAGYSLAS